MAITKFINLNERQQESLLINQIATAVYGTPEDTAFMEEFIPPRGRVPELKIPNFSGFLTSYPTCLWAVFSDDLQKEVVGFILIANKPHPNAIGFGIKKAFSRKGIMHKAWEEIKTQPCINYPLYGYTSKRNTAAIDFMESCGFDKNGVINFMGEDSLGFEFKG